MNWAEVKGFRYLRPKRGDVENDLDLEEFIKCFNGDPLRLETLQNAYVFSVSATDDEFKNRWTAFRCLYAEIELEDETYVLNNGRWYKIAKDFTKQVVKDFSDMTESTIDFPEYTSGDELTYNTTAVQAIADSCCMDQEMIMQGGGHNKVEFCDILTKNKQLIHVKKYGGSSVLSHLFAQGVVSGELFVGDEEFRKKLNDKLPDDHKLKNVHERPDPSEYEIVYAIISKSPKTLDIPFFSKVSLRNARRRLTNYGYKVTKKKIQKAETRVLPTVAL